MTTARSSQQRPPKQDGAFRRLAKGDSPRWLAAPALLASNWLFQGMLIMDPAERTFKMALDSFLTVLATFALLAATSWPVAGVIAVAFGLAHTINWLANGQLPVVLKNLGATSMGAGRRQRELDRFARRSARHKGSLVAVHAYGSLARGEANERSDLDVRLLRRPGFRAALGSCAFAMAERARATFRLLPLDVYVVDHARNLGKVIARDELERPVVLWTAEATGAHRSGSVASRPPPGGKRSPPRKPQGGRRR